MTSEDQKVFDLFIVGGGINGCGIARDAVGRGYSVCLCEAGDLGGGTSSASSKLVHGGLRYLEFYEFGLVRKALMEREVLWKIAPHIIYPLRFVLPYHKGMRPAWLLRLGLFIYDHIGGRKLLPPTRVVDLTRDETGAPLRPKFHKGFEYSDCWVDDSRLVVLNARDAVDRGARIRAHTKVTRMSRQNGHWHIEIKDTDSGATEEINAKLVVNAAGPWVDEVLKDVLGRNDSHNVRLVRGSHIVVDRLFDHDRCYILQNSDNRIVFAIPYERDFTLIGTTDEDHKQGLDSIEASRDEVTYLCDLVSDYFKTAVTPDDVIWRYSGVRPLYDDQASKAQETTRDYIIAKEGNDSEAILINIFGGKITTYRKLAEAVVAMAEEALGTKDEAWTANATLPGGDFDATRFDDLAKRFQTRYPFIEPSHMSRLLRAYGTRTEVVLGAAQSPEDLGQHFGADLYEAEVKYLMENEWARDVDDVLFRRTKLGIRFQADERSALGQYMALAQNSVASFA